MRTRSFVSEEDGERLFWEISWEGPEVEISSGRLGTPGRARDRLFDNERLRDTFVEHEVLKIVRKGYREVESLAIATAEARPPVPPEVLRFRRPAWIPRLEDGDGPASASKVGGTPWLQAGEPWPTLDGRPMPLLLQVDLRALPDAGLGDGLLQIFHDGSDLTYDDWEPWTPTKQIRIVAAEGEPAVQDGPSRVPPMRIVGFDRIDELPDAETLRLFGMNLPDAVFDHLVENERPRPGLKIGGWPHWIQAVQYPRCRRTRFPCRFVLQIDSSDRSVSFGDAGIAHVFRSPAYHDLLTMTWQSC